METWPWYKICLFTWVGMNTIFMPFHLLVSSCSLPTENRPRPSNWCTCSSHLADSTLVHHSPSSVSGLSPSSSTVESPSVPLKCKLPPSRETRLISLETSLVSLEMRLVSFESFLISRECTASTSSEKTWSSFDIIYLVSGWPKLKLQSQTS